MQGSGDGEKRSFMLAVRDDAVLGFCRFSAAPDKDDRAERAVPGGTLNGRLHSLYIDPETLGQGIGHTLMSHALSTFAAWGCERATLWVLEGNSRSPSASTNGKAGGVRALQRWTSPLGCGLVEHEMAVHLNAKPSSIES